MLDIKALENALSTIGNLGKGEITFTVSDIPVTMRVLTADEDITVQRYARNAGGEDGQEETEGLTLLERYKRATLSYAIVAVGPVDLHDEEFVTTGETTDKGVPVRVPRHLAVRKIIDGWTRVATMSLFQKYLELVERVDAEAEKAVHFNSQDLEAEIGRVEKRLADLKQEKERVNIVKSGGSPLALGEADKAAQERIRSLSAAAAGRVAEPPASPEVESEPEAPSPQFALPPRPPPPRPSAPAAAEPVPEQETRPVEPVVRQRVAPPAAAPPAPPRAPVAPPPRAEPADPGFDGMMDSLGDSPEALAAETARLTQMRLQARRASLEAAQAAVAAEEQNIVPGGPGRRSPPHRAAANLANSLVDTGASSFEAVRPASPVDGKEAYRLGTTPIIDRARPPAGPPNRKVAVNEKPKDGPTNPRFRPAGR